MLNISSAPAPRIGEIIATSVTEFEAQAIRLHESPPLGALVRVRSSEQLITYGIVVGASTSGLDIGARPIPRGRDGCEDADIYREHPDLEYVLRTCFRCLVVGFRDTYGVAYHLPEAPPPIHYSVTLCPPEETEQFTRKLDFFRLILNARDVPAEEALAAHIRFSAAQLGAIGRSEDQARAYTVRAGREVAALLRGDHERVMAVVERIRPRWGDVAHR